MIARFLNESLISTKHLKNYLDKNCPEPEWTYDAVCSKEKIENYKYPNGFPSEWFIVDDHLYVAFMRIEEVMVRHLFLNFKRKEVTVEENFVFYFYEERGQTPGMERDPITEDDRKIMTVSIKNIMRKASALKSVEAVGSFFAKAAKKDFDFMHNF